MNWLNKLERKMGKFYIRNLMLIIISGTVLVYGLTLLSNNFALVNNITLGIIKYFQDK